MLYPTGSLALCRRAWHRRHSWEQRGSPPIRSPEGMHCDRLKAIFINMLFTYPMFCIHFSDLLLSLSASLHGLDALINMCVCCH